MRLQPQGAGCNGRINAGLRPPSCLGAAVMDFPVVPSAQGDGELIADLAAERTILRKA